MSEKSKYESRNPIQQYLLRNFLASVARAFRATGGRHIVEIGCGEAYVYDYLRTHSGVAFDYAGYDADGAAIVRARNRFPDATFMQGDIHDLQVSTDVVLCIEVLEHLQMPDRAVERMSAMHADYFIVSVPHEPWFRLGNLARGRHVGRLGNHPDHVNNWNKTTFAALLGPYFEIAGDYSSFPWIMYLLRKASFDPGRQPGSFVRE